MRGVRTGSAYWGPRLALGWAGLVFVFAVLPTHAALRAPVGERETPATQIGHFIEFAILAGLATWWISGRRDDGTARVPLASMTAMWVAAVCYGALLELIQAPLPYRSAQLSDLAIDAAGALAGVLTISCVRALRGRRARRRVR